MYVNVIGGLKVNEPACDLSVAVAIVSNLKNRPVPADMVILGEVGLTGNIRSIPRIEQRIAEAAKMGFTRFVVPAGKCETGEDEPQGYYDSRRYHGTRSDATRILTAFLIMI